MYAELCRRFVDDPLAAAIVGEHPGQREVLALLGALHYLVLGGEASWDDPLREHEEFLRDWVRTHGVQTNEVQRCWVLLPLFLRVTRGAEAVDIVELGSSAGLNLVWDRYRYEYERGSWGPSDASLTLVGTERRPLPADLLLLAPNVRSRIGIDRAPIDVTTDEGVRYLKSFVWAGQDERLARLDAAVAAVRSDPPAIVQGELPDALPDVLAELPGDGLTLVFQTSVFEYLPAEGRARVREILDSSERDLVLVASGSPRGDERVWGMRIYRPGREREFVGHADYHGTWLDYW